MQLASIPENEEQRLASIVRMNIIATPREADFDRIVRLAKLYFDVETCIITTAGKDTIWTHANAGKVTPYLKANRSDHFLMSFKLTLS